MLKQPDYITGFAIEWEHMRRCVYKHMQIFLSRLLKILSTLLNGKFDLDLYLVTAHIFMISGDLFHLP